MEKRKKWQFWLIVAVLALTLYNILPTLFYYAKPLHEPIHRPAAQSVAVDIVTRVNEMEPQAEAWIASFCRLLHLSPKEISCDRGQPQWIKILFTSGKEAALFSNFLPAAGSLIPFVPAQLSLAPARDDQRPEEVYVKREVGVHLDPEHIEDLFRFSYRMEGGEVTPLYRKVIYDRTQVLALALGGPSRFALQAATIAGLPEGDSSLEDVALSLAKELVDVDRGLIEGSLAARWYAYLAQGKGGELRGEPLMEKFAAKLELLKVKLAAKRELMEKQRETALTEGALASGETGEMVDLLSNQVELLKRAISLISSKKEFFAKAQMPLQPSDLEGLLLASKEEAHKGGTWQRVELKGYHPFFDSIVIDWSGDLLFLHPYDDLQALRNETEAGGEERAFAREQINQQLFNEVARLGSLTDEVFTANGDLFVLELNNLENVQSFLTFDLGYVARLRGAQVAEQLRRGWQPHHPDLSRANFPIMTYEEWQKLPEGEGGLGLVVYAPAAISSVPSDGFSFDSLYVLAKGLSVIEQKYRDQPSAEGADLLRQDLAALGRLLQQEGFFSLNERSSLYRDLVFCRDDYYAPLIKATREDFWVKGSKRYAVLAFTDLEQRILARNRIWDREQEDLLKRYEEYQSAQVDLNPTKRYLVPAPTQNPYWENFKISVAKYFGGDDRKVLKWGLDLSGGKTVRIGLVDGSHRPVKNPDDLRQAVNELYGRVNKMGVSERTIRIENDNIVLEFPGSQGLSASELVKASAMYFHIVNEKFSPGNSALTGAVRAFLEGVWNEAVVTNRKDSESVRQIARKHLGEGSDELMLQPRSEYAKILYEAGLRLAPSQSEALSSFDDTLSSIAILRGEEFSEWGGQSHPLVIVFHNYALEGSSLTNIQVGWDQNEGNVLTFNIKGSFDGARSKSGASPRDDFYEWTSQFAEDRIVGTPKEVYTQGRGWRMAVILNGQVVTMPSLRAALRDSASITGRFTQREINQLAADLKAGSLSFTPKILSEQNVSPELGKEERSKGIYASLLALVSVVVAMVGYYRFGGVVASCAVLFNILILWGVLQNLDAALTLPGIAGIVLTIGMAVDANVLVFERIREEFRVSGRIASAIHAGYSRAFSAIVDSNVTTIIAALILIQFDSGPVRGFAITLIIGILSSMFTALFMTRYFFAGWVQNPDHKELKMAKLIGGTRFDFLGQVKKAMALSLVAIVLGCLLFFSQYRTIFGMDFTGGYALTVEVEKQKETNYRVKAYEALLAGGATSNDVVVRELSYPQQLRIQLGMGMEEKTHPFYQMAQEVEGKYTFPYQVNPRLVWIVDSLEKGGVKIVPSQLGQLEHHWTVMSGQFSDAMRNSAAAGLFLALLAILVYITFRFEFHYAIAALIALIHDVLITMGVVALFHKLGFTIQIDLEAIGAIMTIIGYSLNDTIIVFDRIREERLLMRKSPLREVVNHGINVTLSRTIMTSGTTLLVLLILVLFGGPSIFGFSLIMAVGVVVGTLSSLFIAPPAMIYFHERAEVAALRQVQQI